MRSDVHTRGGTPHITIHTRRGGTPHMKMCSNILTEVGTPHKFQRKNNINLGEVLVVLVVFLVLLVLLVTYENKVNSEPDLFMFVQVRSGWVPSRVGV